MKTFQLQINHHLRPRHIFINLSIEGSFVAVSNKQVVDSGPPPRYANSQVSVGMIIVNKTKINPKIKHQFIAFISGITKIIISNRFVFKSLLLHKNQP